MQICEIKSLIWYQLYHMQLIMDLRAPLVGNGPRNFKRVPEGWLGWPVFTILSQNSQQSDINTELESLVT